MSSSRFDLLVSGAAYFESLLKDCHEAQSEILMEVYIFQADSTGQRLLSALAHARRRGVQVSLIVDSYGSAKSLGWLKAEAQKADLELLLFRPLSYRRFSRSFFRRLHRKTFVVDQRFATLGGFNIADDYVNESLPTYKWDVALRVEGGVARDIARHSKELKIALQGKWESLFESLRPIRASWKPQLSCRYLTRDHWMNKTTIERAYLKALRESRSEILLANAYFFPSRSFLRALEAAAERGVRVRLLLQGLPEIRIVKWAESYLYEALQRQGVELYEYLPHYLHAKVAVIDANWLTVGSSNLDPWSLISNLEGNLVVEDPKLAQDLREVLVKTMEKDCRRIQSMSLPWILRLRSWMAYRLMRLAERLVKINSPTSLKDSD